MNAGIRDGLKTRAQQAQDFLHEVFHMGKPEVIQADGTGAFFMFSDSQQLYKLPYTLIGSNCLDLRLLKV